MLYSWGNILKSSYIFGSFIFREQGSIGELLKGSVSGPVNNQIQADPSFEHDFARVKCNARAFPKSAIVPRVR